MPACMGLTWHCSESEHTAFSGCVAASAFGLCNQCHKLQLQVTNPTPPKPLVSSGRLDFRAEVDFRAGLGFRIELDMLDFRAKLDFRAELDFRLQSRAKPFLLGCSTWLAPPKHSHSSNLGVMVILVVYPPCHAPKNLHS